ncbi:putative mucin TcMUCII, partial [Trypanosoma cruzi]
MMTCRLLCALLVLALCCCPSVCVAADVDDKANNSGGHSDSDESGKPRTLQPKVNGPANPGSNGLAVTLSGSNETAAPPESPNPNGVAQVSSGPTSSELGPSGLRPQSKQIRMLTPLPRRQRPPQKHQPRPRLHRHQALLRPQRRQPRRPPAHRHVFAKSTAASAALRGCVPHCCLPHPRWRTPLWA